MAHEASLTLRNVRLTKDPEMKQRQNGSQYVMFTVANTVSYKAQTGQWQDGDTTYYTVFLNQQSRLQSALQMLHKGTMVNVEGVPAATINNYNSQQSVQWSISPEVSLALPYAKKNNGGVYQQNNQYTPQPQGEDPWGGTYSSEPEF